MCVRVCVCTFRNMQAVKNTIMHFQLRNLVWATSKHDVYTVRSNVIQHWNLVNGKSTDVLDLSGRAGAVETLISTTCVKDDIVAAGGFRGELVARRLNEDATSTGFSTYVTSSVRSTTNAVAMNRSRSGAMNIMTSSNDCAVRIFDLETLGALGPGMGNDRVRLLLLLSSSACFRELQIP